MSQISPCWQKELQEEFQKDYMKELKKFLIQEKKGNKIIYPTFKNIFKAFELSPFSKVKVVILGQDPYHQPGQAHGLSFSVPLNVPPPPSLQNIFKEIKNDLNLDMNFENGSLISWAKQGVLLLNSSLSVIKGRPGSHSKKGWENFTDKVIEILSQKKSNLVFLLWGAYAIKKANLIDSQKHLVLKARHPSPFSAHKGFFGCKHFSKSNTYLESHNQKPISWNEL